MIIEITDQAKKEAREYEEKVRSKGIIDEGNYTGINQKDRFAIGYLGEWVFNEFLKKCNVKDKIIWSRDADGMADHGDFFFGGKIIDVKTASREFYQRIMMPVTQYELHKRDYYVAVRLNDEKTQGEIMGYLRYEDLKDVRSEDFGYGETKAVLFSKLRPIKDLIEQEVLLKWQVQ